MEKNNDSGNTNTTLIIVVLVIVVVFGIWWFTMRNKTAPVVDDTTQPTAQVVTPIDEVDTSKLPGGPAAYPGIGKPQ